MIDSEDEKVQRLAKRAIGNSRDPWDKAVKIEHWVFQNIRDKNFATAFAPASEVARNLTGDCSEHAVLAAAMCRAVGIPSRVAVGLLYMDDDRRRLKGFGFHMWHEVYVNRPLGRARRLVGSIHGRRHPHQARRHQPRRRRPVRGLPAHPPRPGQAGDRPDRAPLNRASDGSATIDRR